MYYYEHVNGTIHTKPDIVVDMGGGPGEYFAGPFVKKWWHLKDEEIENVRIQDKHNTGYGSI